MYASDYGYSMLASSCARTRNIGTYNTEACVGQSWLYGKGAEWILTPGSSGSSHMFYLFSVGGPVYTNSANRGYAIRPVLYLDASVYKIAGDGSLDSPYIVGM